jgi:hypothetical protein
VTLLQAVLLMVLSSPWQSFSRSLRPLPEDSGVRGPFV